MASAGRDGRELVGIKKLNEENMVNLYQQIFNPRILFVGTIRGENVSNRSTCEYVPYLL